MKYNAYIASGWFSEAQEKSRQEVLAACKEVGIVVYSPKEEAICAADAGHNTREDIFSSNITAIRDSTFVIVNTQDKDMGTIFEAGVAYALAKPIIYYASGLKGNFNLMLAESGKAVATTPEQLVTHIKHLLAHNFIYKVPYNGHIE